MNNTSLIIQSTRVVHKDFIHLIETMRSNFDNIYYLKNDDSHLDIVFKNNKNIKSIVIKRNNMSDRFDKFLCLWKEISYLSKNIESEYLIIIRSDFYINPIDFCKIIEVNKSLIFINNYSLPYIPLLGRYFLQGHCFDGFIKIDKNLSKNIYSEIKCNIEKIKKSIFSYKFNTPKVNYLGKCPEYFLLKSLRELCKDNILKIDLKNCEWIIKKWGILDYIFRKPFFKIKK